MPVTTRSQAKRIRSQRPGLHAGASIVGSATAGLVSSIYNAVRSAGRANQKALAAAPKGSPGAVLTSENRVVNTYKSKRKGKKLKKYRATGKLVKRIADYKSPQRVFNFVTTYTAECAYGYSRYSAMLMGTFSDNVYKNTLYEVGNKLVDYATNVLKFNVAGFTVDNMHQRTVIRNITTTPSDSGNWSGTLDIDVYHVICRRQVAATELATDVESMLSAWKNWQNQAKSSDGVNDVTYAGAGIAMAQQNAGLTAATQAVGDTLFDNGMFCKYFKIVKVQKVQLPVGETIELNMHHSRDFYVPHSQLQTSASLNKNLFARSGVTQGYIINTNGRLYTNSAGPPVTNFALGKLQIENYVRYSVKPISGEKHAQPSLDYKQTII